ncbi:MAG: RNA methyltransferase [Bacteroidales bacterium]|nr:RNA methyltransferase [Bacteroidales bacterium]
MSLSRNKIKFIRSLKEKKFRNEHRVFVAEGDKLVCDLLQNFHCQLLAALPEWLASHPNIHATEMVAADISELNKATFLKTPPPVIAVFERPEHQIQQFDPTTQLCLALDGIQDPGNMGTITRVADWFGIGYMICSADSADLYSPKTVQASMGAIARVKPVYTDVANYLKQHTGVPIYGTFLNGENIYTEKLSPTGIIVMGNEGKGIRGEVEKLINKRLFIPPYPTLKDDSGNHTLESLNVATATAIVCSEFRRREE